MAVEAYCDKCKAEIPKEGGALVFGPPVYVYVLKMHICRNCWKLLLTWIMGEEAH